MENDFCRACERGHLATVKDLVRQGVNINCTSDEVFSTQWSGLAAAVCHGYYDIVLFLLSLPGIDVNMTRTYQGYTALHWAAIKNISELILV